MTQDTGLAGKLEQARQELLDVSTRNRLLSTPRSRTRSSRLEIVDEKADEVFRHLVTEGKVMSFLPSQQADDAPKIAAEDFTEAPSDDTAEPLLAQPGDETEGATQRHTDDKLQTSLASEQLQKKLLKMYYDAKTYQEEQGVNILYLAIGFLKWYEDDRSERERFAPLLLIPVTLDRQSATSRFKIRYTDDDITTNLSLQARLKQDFGIQLPEVPPADELSPSAYFATVSAVIQDQKRWSVVADDMVLWFFSFSKFLMYRDLVPENWPKDDGLDQQEIVQALLRDGFRDDPPLCDDDDPIDPLIAPIDMVHVLDADSSQALVIEEAKRGRNLVIQGPPGTGKSQTISNVIAAAVAKGKSVLFVAEKLAALDVVRRRLVNSGLGDMCLELHSNKANKRTVMQDLERTLRLGKPQAADVARLCQELGACREQLNGYLQIIHTPGSAAGYTPFQAVGELVRLRSLGTQPPTFKLAEALKWSHDEFQTRRNLLHEFAEQVTEIGVPDEHPWRGVGLESVLPTDADRLLRTLPTVLECVNRLTTTAQPLADALQAPPPDTLQAVSYMAQLADKLEHAPPMDRQALASSPAWQQNRPQIDELLKQGQQLAECRGKLAGKVAEVAWKTDVAEARKNLAAYGRSWICFFWGAYRAAQATLRGILVAPPPKSLDERLALLDTLMQGQQAAEYVTSESPAKLGSAAFGLSWSGASTNWANLAEIAAWESQCRTVKGQVDFPKILATLADPTTLQAPRQRATEELASAQKVLTELFQTLKLDLTEAFGAADATAISFAALAERLKAWQASQELLSQWTQYAARRRALQAVGLGELVQQVHTGDASPNEGVARFETAYFEELMREAFRTRPELASFQGASHETLMQKFRGLDETRLKLAQQEVASAHYGRIPKAGSLVGEIGVVRREIQKKRGHLPIRKLLSQAGRAVQAIKPVFMMSPISVAQYLEPGALEFDLLLIDEASQVQPVDALGAMARAKQIVVVGDSKQLPPTRFFDRMLGDDGHAEGADDAEGVNTADIESILGLCCAQNVPQRMLRWHYRSKHHTLIATSNHEFYEDQLYVIPSPALPGPGQGLNFRHIAEGKFDRGASATNRIEAKAVAEAVMAHARERPSKSLGVGTFSVAQRDAILDELELLRRSDPASEPFFATATTEPFFVKNLENIQGDERDVIFISVGYGKNESGTMAMNFGPLSNDGGERRLNVLITRAKECCCVFSSIRADDIDLDRAKARGAQAFKHFLKYAETGLLDTGTTNGRDHDSEFERQVARALEQHGHKIHPQVGVAGFFIDLAIVDPDAPGRYLLGVECDGANYHRARSARDRDRLRQAVLKDRGWVIHRIWSTDWFHRPDEQIRKVFEAIERAKVVWAERSQSKVNDQPAAPTTPPAPVEIAREQAPAENAADSGETSASVPYQEAAFKVPTQREIHDLSTAELATILVKIIEIEGPIHQEEIARRVTQLWKLQRTGSRIRDAVDQALAAIRQNPALVIDHEFYWLKQAPIRVRDRAKVDSAALRKPELIASPEIEQAVLDVVQTHVGAQQDEIATEVARMLGFKATSSQLRERIDSVIASMVQQNTLALRNTTLYAAAPA